MPRLDPRAGALRDGWLSLRHWGETDVPALVEALADPEVSRWVLTIPWPYTYDDARRFLRFADGQRTSEAGAHLGVFERDGGALVGAVALAPIDWGNRSASLGYWTAREHRNRGVARAASRLLVTWAFGDLGLERIELTCHPANAGSRRVAEALGFRREGHLREHLRTAGGRRDSLLYGLLPSDPVRGPSAPSP